MGLKDVKQCCLAGVQRENFCAAKDSANNIPEDLVRTGRFGTSNVFGKIVEPTNSDFN